MKFAALVATAAALTCKKGDDKTCVDNKAFGAGACCFMTKVPIIGETYSCTKKDAIETASKAANIIGEGYCAGAAKLALGAAALTVMASY